jgi:FkbM family methyltransferase
MTQFFNTLQQIKSSESVGTARGVYRHLQWQLRRQFKGFPCELKIGSSTLYVERPNGVAALVNAMGEYDFNNMSLLRMLLSRGKSTFLDIGANIGTYTLIASEVTEAIVVSFEPHPATFARLQENVRRNARENVVCLNLALSREEGELRLTDISESPINRVVSAEENGVGTLRVPCRRVDAVCRELNLTPDFAKIDVEGFEDAVLNGLGEYARTAKLIFIEGGERQEVQSWMDNSGYTGPWYSVFKGKQFSTEKQRRPEDPVFIHRGFLSELRGLGFEISGVA